MPNQVVQEILFRAIGLDQLTSMLKTAGASQQELDRVAKEYLKTQKEQEAVSNTHTSRVQARTAALKEQAVTLADLNAKMKENGGLAKGSSYAQALGSDPMTRDFLRFQSAMSREQAKQGKLTDPAEIAASQTRIQQLERQYGSLGVKIADTAGIGRKMFAQDIGPQEYQRIVEAATKLHREQGKVGNAFQEVSTKARFSTNQIMQYTAAARNTAESLASGISLQTTLLTQGMQVLGATVGDNIGLMVRLGVVAAATAPAVVTIARALSLASQDRDIAAATRAYGGMVQGVEGAADAMRVLADNSKFSRGEIAEAFKELTKLQTMSSSMRGGIQGAITPFATATGKTPVEATKELIGAFDGTYDSIRKLDQQYNFLTASQLEQIRAMMKQNDVIGASRIAMDAFNNQMRDAANIARTDVSVAFQDMAKAYNDALDSMAKNPATQTLLKNLAFIMRGTADVMSGDWSISDWLPGPNIMKSTRIAQDRLNAFEKSNGTPLSDYGVPMYADGYVEPTFNDPNKAITDITTEYGKQLKLTKAIGVERARIEGERRGREIGVKAGLEGDALTSAEKRGGIEAVRVAQVEIDRQTAALRRQGDAELAVARAIGIGANAMSEARAQAAAREAAATGQNARAAYEVSLMKDRTQALSALDTEMEKSRQAMELSNRAREVGIDQATIEMRLKQMVTGGVNNEVEARTKLAAILANEADLRRRAADVEMSAERARIGLIANDNLTTGERAYSEAMVGPEAQRAAGQIGNVDFAIAQEKALIAQQRANAEAGRSIRDVLEPQVKLRTRLAEIEEASGVNEQQRSVMRRQAEKDYEDAMLRRMQLEEDWLSGVERGWLRYKQSVGTWSDQMEGFVVGAFGHMEDAFVQMAMTGKMNFADMANAILADLIRIQIRMQMMGAMESVGGFGGIFGALFGNGNGAATNADVSGMTADMNTGGAFMGGMEAHGGIYDGAGRIAFARGGTFTNSVVNGNTPFRFASGGAFGVMGEAGPEAIVPLTRTAQGDLGIRSVGGGAQVKVEVIDQRGSGAAPIDVETQMGAFGPIVRIIARDEAQKAVSGYAKGGGLSTDLRQGYGIRQPAVNRG